VRKAINEH